METHATFECGWTPERTSLLRKLWTEGLSCSEIAKQLGHVSRNAVIGKATRLNLPARAPRGAARVSHGPRPRNRLYAMPSKPREIKAARIKPDGAKPKGALRGPQNVRFIERRSDQCPMFCLGEEGAMGWVCGAHVEVGASWCSSCVGVVFSPVREKVAA